MTTDTKEPKATRKSKLFSYNDLKACVRYYETFALGIPGEVESEMEELVRGWVEEKKPATFRKIFKQKGANHD